MRLSGYGSQGLIPLHRSGGALAAPQGTGLALPTATGAPGEPQGWARLMRCGRGSLVWGWRSERAAGAGWSQPVLVHSCACTALLLPPLTKLCESFPGQGAGYHIGIRKGELF